MSCRDAAVAARPLTDSGHGRHISDFHIDRDAIDDMLARLETGEKLEKYDDSQAQIYSFIFPKTEEGLNNLD